MKALFSFEWKLFWQNIKNIVTFLVFLFLCLYLALAVEPNVRPNRKIDVDEIAATNRDANYFIENSDPIVYQRTVPMFMELAETTEDLLEAIEQEDYIAVMELEDTYYAQNLWRHEGQDPNYYMFGVPQIEREQTMSYDNSAITRHYDFMEEGNYVLSLDIIEGRTAFQALTRQFQGMLPIVLFIVVIIYGIDIFAEDKKHPTIIAELPVTRYKHLGVKSVVVFLSFLFTLLLGSFLFAILTGFRTGFGGLNLPVPHILYNISIGRYLLQVFLLLSLIAFIFIRGMAWLSLFTSKALANFIFIPLLFVGSLWHRTGIAYGQPQVVFYPPTYFRVGDVVSNYLNFWYGSEVVTFNTGMLIMIGVWLLVELLILITLRVRRRSYGIV